MCCSCCKILILPWFWRVTSFVICLMPVCVLLGIPRSICLLELLGTVVRDTAWPLHLRTQGLVWVLAIKWNDHCRKDIRSQELWEGVPEHGGRFCLGELWSGTVFWLWSQVPHKSNISSCWRKLLDPDHCFQFLPTSITYMQCFTSSLVLMVEGLSFGKYADCVMLKYEHSS